MALFGKSSRKGDSVIQQARRESSNEGGGENGD
jgi:hypothetical protein